MGTGSDRVGLAHFMAVKMSKSEWSERSICVYDYMYYADTHC